MSNDKCQERSPAEPMNVFVDPRFDEIYRQHPIVLVDVGARGGLRQHWEPVKPHLHLIGFEPDPREYEVLARQTTSDRTIRFLPTALHSERATLELHIARDRGLTSIFRPNRPFLDTFPDASRFDTIDVQRVEADSLDAIVRRETIEDVDFMKVDTQGSELFILRGASSTLRSQMVGVEVEAEFAPVYQDQPLFADVDAYMRGAGFVLFDLRPCYWKRAAGWDLGGPHGQIIWADALYMKSAAALQQLLAPLPADRAKAKLLKTITVAVLYGYYDYALELARTAGPWLTEDERRTIESRLRADGGADDSIKFPGSGKVAAALHRGWKKLARNQGWSISDPGLGNDR
jgi:FkbM family methyltransferase